MELPYSFHLKLILYYFYLVLILLHDIRNNFLKIKNIILIKNTFKNNYFQTTNNTIKYIH